MTRECDEFKQAKAKNLVFWKDKKIHASMTRLPLPTNFRKGGMKKILEEMLANVAKKEGATYGVRVDDGREEGQNSKKGFWTSALKIAEKGKVARSTL